MRRFLTGTATTGHRRGQAPPVAAAVSFGLAVFTAVALWSPAAPPAVDRAALPRTLPDGAPPERPPAGPASVPAPPGTRQPPISAVPATAATEISAAPTARSIPRRIRVPRIRIDTPLVPLGLDDQQRLEVPSDFAEAGIYEDGPRPGEVGPAVIVGHVDSKRGPAVFFRLAELRPGDRIQVEYDDAPTETFAVYHRGQFPKDAFPTEAVYGDTAGPELRLITCGGTFDRSSGHYRDNIVVWAAASR